MIGASIAWGWLMPGGFPVGHPRFWLNQVLPPLAVVGAGLGVVALLRPWTALARLSTLMLVLASLAGTIAGAALFSVSFGGMLVLGAVIVGALVWRWIASWGALGLRARGTVLVGAMAAVIGVGVVWAQRAPLADTRPSGEPAPAVSGAVMPAPTLRVGPRVTVFPADAVVRIDARVSLEIAPLLQFISVSPDRFWTLFAPEDAHTPAPWKLVQAEVGEAALGLAYHGDAERRLWVGDPGEAVVLDASARLAAPVYSHLNSFTRITIHGHRRLTLEFAAAPGRRIEPLPSDYPVGRPLRFAYVDDAQLLRVMTATSGEKGPFRELASGALPEGEPLVLILCDEDEPVWRLTLTDWPAQRGRSLSPTAGWGVPSATLEFARNGEQTGSSVEIWISLASTSVGRGFDSVGHAAGTYRNRIRVEALSTP